MMPCSLLRRIPAGADGLLFLPYLTGERTPHPDPLAPRFGIDIRHNMPHLTRGPGRRLRLARFIEL
jgi:xylulokinase